MLTRRTPLRRTPMSRPSPPPRPPQRTARPEAWTCRAAPLAECVVAVPKCEPVRHEGYRRLVAARPCAWCGRCGRSQAAHADMDKGMGIKTDDRTCFAACAPTLGDEGCHEWIGRRASRALRRDLEAQYGRETRAAIRAAGLWPADLPAWPEDD